MAVPKATIEAIRERSDIAEIVGRHVTLKRRGGNYVGLCPFHQERSPSFNVNPARQIFHCFGCGAGGDVFRFLMDLEGLSFMEAVKELAGAAGITVEERELTPAERHRLERRATLHDVCEEAARFFHTTLLTRPEAATARAYLQRRGLTMDTLQRARLGYAPAEWTRLLDHLQRQGVPPELAIQAGLARPSERTGRPYDNFRDRVIFPIHDARDRVVAFGARLLEGDGPKYLNSPETEIYEKSSTLYGLPWARAAIQRTGRAIVVEGYFDVLTLQQAGFLETVATCGTALTPGHVDRLKRFTRDVIALFDGDEAGQRAAEKALPMFVGAGMDARALDLLDAKDPDEFVLQKGAEAFGHQVERAVPLVERILQRVAARHGTTAAGRQRAMDDVAPVLRQLPDIARGTMVRRAADTLGLSEAEVTRAVGRADRPPGPPRRAQAARWVGSRDLNHLLWLLVHHPKEVGPVVAAFDPALLTDREDVLWATASLLDGAPLTSVLDAVADDDLRRLLQQVAARDDLYPADRAALAARQIMHGLETRALEQRSLGLHQELLAAERAGDVQRMRELIAERASLQGRLPELRRLASRKHAEG